MTERWKRKNNGVGWVARRILNPEEEELERKPAELAALQGELSERELERATLRGDLSGFERCYNVV